MIKVPYEDCLRFIENYLNIELFDFQRTLLKALCNGDDIRGGRGCGRSTVVKGYTKYLSRLLDENYCDTKPNVMNSSSKLRNLQSNNLLSSKIEETKLAMSPHSVKDGYFAQFYCIDEKPFVEFKNGSWIKVKNDDLK